MEKRSGIGVICILIGAALADSANLIPSIIAVGVGVILLGETLLCANSKK